MSIRSATSDDLGAMLTLADQKHTEYAQYAPTFWRKAVDGSTKQRAFFLSVLTKPNVIALVNEDNGSINGFLIASIIDAPPVYDPGSRVCLIDDFLNGTSIPYEIAQKKLVKTSWRRHRATHKRLARQVRKVENHFLKS